MERQVFAATGSSYRSAGWAAIASGVIGVVAFGLLITGVTTRSTWIIPRQVKLLFEGHDIGAVLQYILLIPVALGLQKLSFKSPPGINRATLATGVGAICFIALLLLLGVGKVVNDMFYMVPQGIFGAWLIVINWHLIGLLPRWLIWFGMVVGLGLVLVGTVFPGLAIFVYPTMLKIPAVPQENYVFQNTQINYVLHRILDIGTFIGVVTLPFWTILTGFQLFKAEDPEGRTGT
jgi:hypothetical protein